MQKEDTHTTTCIQFFLLDLLSTCFHSLSDALLCNCIWIETLQNGKVFKRISLDDAFLQPLPG